MKKLYKVNVERCDAMEGKTCYTDVEYVLTDNIDEYVENVRVAIENTPYWWMDHRREWGGENDRRPLVTAEALTVTEA